MSVVLLCEPGFWTSGSNLPMLQSQQADARVSRRSLLSSTKTNLFRRLQGLSLSGVDEDVAIEDFWGPLGLILLHEPSDPFIDFIFVHGLGGGSRKTWSKTRSPAHYWPKAWLPSEPQFKNVRIHAFGYNATWKERHASNLTIHDFGQALLTDIRNSPILGRTDTPVVLVGHSMGGLVIKKMFLLAKQDPNTSEIASRIHTFFFLATPHRGSSLANTLNNLLKLAVGHGSKAYVDDLFPYSAAIQTINDQFRHAYQGKHLYSFFETVPTTLGLIVEKTSAVLELPGEQVSHLNADHSQVCKFDTPSDRNYIRLKDAFVANISLIQKTYLASRVKKRQDEIETLARYLGLKEPPGNDLADIIEHQVAGSCVWLTDKNTFHQWLDDDKGNFPRCYWLRGESGSGKSTLASHVVNFLEVCNNDCAYFFFKHLQTGKSTIAELLCSLALQMASTNESIRQKLLEMYDSGMTIDTKDERSIWRTLFATRILRVEFQQPQYWVIDGLDECANPARFFPLVANIQKQVRLRVFITSRPSLIFERAFSRENIPNIAEAIPLDATLSDIRIYLNEYSSYFLAESEEERQELVQTILDMSNANFLWTDLVVKKIEDAVSKEQVHNILNSVPKEMDQLYREITSSVMASSDNASIAKAILKWTLCSLRPLSVDELREALKLDIGVSLNQLDKTAGSICGNLVYVDSDSRVQATHQTVREFFLGHSQEEFDHAMNGKMQQAHIAEICLSYLVGDDMKPRRFRRANSHAHKKETKRSPFSSYAMVYFSDHIVNSPSSRIEPLVALNKFMMSNAMAWIEAVAMTDDLTPLTRTASNLKIYMGRRAKHESGLGVEDQNVLTWANDLVCLVAQFGKTLTTSPQTIYHLIPAICPRNSIIFNASKTHPRGLQVVGVEHDEWDERLCCISFPGTQVYCAACQDNNFALGTSKGKIHIYDETTFQEKAQLSHGEPIRRLCFGTMNDYLVSVGRKQLKYWSLSTGQIMWSLATRDEVIALAFGDEDQLLYIANRANHVLAIDVRTGEEAERFRFADWNEDEKREYKFQRSPMHVEFMVGLGLLGVTYLRRPVNLWDLEEHEFVGLLYRSGVAYSAEPFIHAFKFNPNPEMNLAAVSYQDGSTYIFDPELQKVEATADTDATVLAASPDGTVLAIGSGDGFIKFYDFETMKLLHQIFLYQRAVRSIMFNSSGRRLLDLRSNYCNVWEPLALMRTSQHTNEESSTDMSACITQVPRANIMKAVDDGRVISAIIAHHTNDFVFCGREDGSVAAYSTKTGKVAQELFCDCRNVAVDFLQWNERRNLLVSADRAGQLLVRQLSTVTPGPFELSRAIIRVRPTLVVSQILVSPDGERLLISTAEHDTFWNLTSASLIQKCERSQPRSPGKWANHPDNETLLLFEDSRMKSYKWATLEDDATQSATVDSSDLGVPDMAVTGFYFPSQCRYACLMASSNTTGANVTTRTQVNACFRLFSAKTFSSTTRATTHASRSLETIKDLKAIVGTYKSWLVYLQQGGWVCTVNIDTASHDRFYLRHFLVPLHWHGVTVSPMVVTPKGSVVMVVEDEIVVFHNGLNFEEKVLV